MGFAGVGFAQDDDPCVQTMDKASEKVFKKAREYHKSGKKEEAYELYEEILADHPEYLEVNYYYALGYYLPLKDNQYYSKSPTVTSMRRRSPISTSFILRR